MKSSTNPPFRVNRAYVGLGSNQGDPAVTLRSALDALARIGTVAAVSPLYETDPIGFEQQPAFLNAVAALDTALEPLALLDELLGIEADHGRERTIRFGPRTLDLDLIWYGGLQMEGDRLTLPHPRAAEREFVLRPLADIAPDLELDGRSVAARLAGLPPQGVRVTGQRLI